MNKQLVLNLAVCFAGALIFWSVTSSTIKYLNLFLNEGLMGVVYFSLFSAGYYLLSSLRMIDFMIFLRSKRNRYFRVIVVSAFFISFINLVYAFFKFAAGEMQGGSFLVTEQKWLFIPLVLSMGTSYIDKRSIIVPSYLFAGVATGVIVFFASIGLAIMIDDQLLVNSLSILIIMTIMPNITDMLNARLSVAKLKIINGPLKGYIFSLDNTVCLLGNQESDDVNLSLYANVNYSHAKIIPFGPVHSIADNDPYCNTFVNYDHFSETVLKDGDIIGIGSARLQYIYK